MTRTTIPTGFGDAPDQVDSDPCGASGLTAPIRRAFQGIWRAFRVMNGLDNFPRSATATAGWEPGSPPTVACTDDATGIAVTINLMSIPSLDPNVQTGDTVWYIMKSGGVAWSWITHDDGYLGKLALHAGSVGSIKPGWAVADGSNVAQGGNARNYTDATYGFLKMHATTAGTQVAVGNTGGSGNHSHTGTASGNTEYGGTLQTSRTLVTIAAHPPHTHAQPDHEEHHHHVTADTPTAGSGDQVVSGPDTSGVIHTSGDHAGALVHEENVPSITLDHNSLKPSTAGTIANATYYAGSNTTIINFTGTPFSDPLPVAGDIYYFSDGTSATILSGDEDTITVTGDFSSETGTGELIQGHFHTLIEHLHGVSVDVTISDNGGHAHTAGVPAHVTVIPIERVKHTS